MLNLSSIEPDVELRNLLQGQVFVGVAGGGSKEVAVYGDWERPTNEIPDDFLLIYMNGDIQALGMDTPFAKGYIMVSLYCKLNEDGTVKKNRIKNILKQFDSLVEKCETDHYFFEYDSPRFITPTTPNQTSGFSLTTLNLKWNTTSNFNS